MTDLLIGCGSNRERKIKAGGRAEWSGLVTLDMAALHGPDVVHDLASLPLPFADDSFDEIHAYDVLEHTGQQGDWRFFFDQWADFWRMLKPDGLFCGISPGPKSPWLWGDPGHTRSISPECFVYLHQPAYAQIGQSPMTDYRFAWKGDFDAEALHVSDNQQFVYVLKAVKPSRCLIR